MKSIIALLVLVVFITACSSQEEKTALLEEQHNKNLAQYLKLDASNLILSFDYLDTQEKYIAASNNDSIFMVHYTLKKNAGKKSWQQMHDYAQKGIAAMANEPQYIIDVYKNEAAQGMILHHLSKERSAESRKMTSYYLDMFYESRGSNATIAAVALNHIGHNEAARKEPAFIARVNKWLERTSKDYAKEDKLASGRENVPAHDLVYLQQQQNGIQALQALL